MLDENKLHYTQPSFEKAMQATVAQEKADYDIKLIHGDCLKKLLQLEQHSIHLAVTDPPYFLDGLDNKWKKGQADCVRGSGSVGGLPVGMKFDPRQGVALQEFIHNVAQKMIPALVPGAFAVVFSQPRLSHRMAIGLETAGFEIRDILAWHFTKRAQFKAFGQEHFVDKKDVSKREREEIKRALQGRKTPQLRPQFEAMILAQKPREGTFVDNWIEYRTGLIDPKASLDGKAPSTVMRAEKPERDKHNGHLTVKPTCLVEHLIRLFSLPGQVVLDPFLGSGTTAVAASRTRRSCIGIEVRKDYITIAKNRIKKLPPPNGSMPDGSTQ